MRIIFKTLTLLYLLRPLPRSLSLCQLSLWPPQVFPQYFPKLVTCRVMKKEPVQLFISRRVATCLDQPSDSLFLLLDKPLRDVIGVLDLGPNIYTLPGGLQMKILKRNVGTTQQDQIREAESKT